MQRCSTLKCRWLWVAGLIVSGVACGSEGSDINPQTETTITGPTSTSGEPPSGARSVGDAGAMGTPSSPADPPPAQTGGSAATAPRPDAGAFFPTDALTEPEAVTPVEPVVLVDGEWQPLELETVDCPALAGAVALPEDFSRHEEPTEPNSHTLAMGYSDMIRRVSTYQTAEADSNHQHQLHFTNDALDVLLQGRSISIVTTGPAVGADDEHRHRVTVHPCAR